MDRICIFKLLLNCNKIDAFLKLLVIGYEKWVTYNNVNRHRSWSNRGAPVQTLTKPLIDGLAFHCNYAKKAFNLMKI